MKNRIKVIAFDADDTLWENEPYFRDNEARFSELMLPFQPNKEECIQTFYKIVIKNLPLYGFGIKAFMLSMTETALKISNNKVSNEIIAQILDIGKKMLQEPVVLYDNVEEVLKQLQKEYKLIVVTKGDLLDQERKLKKSNLEKYFHHIEIVSDKAEEQYLHLINHLDVSPSEFLMIGNSAKSDILPVLNIGGWGIFIPSHFTWQHEQVDLDERFTNNNKFFSVNSIIEILGILK